MEEWQIVCREAQMNITSTTRQSDPGQEEEEEASCGITCLTALGVAMVVVGEVGFSPTQLSSYLLLSVLPRPAVRVRAEVHGQVRPPPAQGGRVGGGLRRVDPGRPAGPCLLHHLGQDWSDGGHRSGT